MDHGNESIGTLEEGDGLTRETGERHLSQISIRHLFSGLRTVTHFVGLSFWSLTNHGFADSPVARCRHRFAVQRGNLTPTQALCYIVPQLLKVVFFARVAVLPSYGEAP